jgi:hypothetical protein
LKLSRNTVRRILRAPDPSAAEAAPCDAQTRALLERLFERAGGNVVRVRELLAQEHGQQLSYSTLTRWVRAAGLRTPPQRSGEYHFEPGEEMQHDTSPHRVLIGVSRVKDAPDCEDWCETFPKLFPMLFRIDLVFGFDLEVFDNIV